MLSSAFAFTSAEQAARAFRGEEDAWIYGRWGNPTVDALEAKLAAIEGAEAACATASGMAAIAGVVLASCEAGDHVVAPRSMYAESARLLRERLPKLGITTTFVDGTPEAYAAAVTDRTRLLYVETPSNPTLGVVDIAAIAELARSLAGRRRAARSPARRRRRHVRDAVRAVSARARRRPRRALDDRRASRGHGDVIGGAVMGARALVDGARELIVKGFGGVLSPLSRVARRARPPNVRAPAGASLRDGCCARGAPRDASARRARASSRLSPAHPGHALASRQMHAYGALLSFELRAPPGGDALDRGRKVLEALRVATHAVSLGDVRTLVVHPASTTHSTMPRRNAPPRRHHRRSAPHQLRHRVTRPT